MAEAKEVFIGQSNAKVILMGEHAVVYHQPAIAIPLSHISAHARLFPLKIEHQRLKSPYFSGELKDVPKSLRGLKQMIQQFLTCYDLNKSGFEIELSSQIPPERGMGSSAAIAVAIVRTMAAWAKQDLTTQELLDFVQISETQAHGSPSGIDAATTSATSPVWFIKGQPISEFPINLNDTFLVIADTGLKGQTGAAVRDIQNQLLLDTALTEQTIKKLGDLTRQAKTAILAQQVKQLGTLMNQAHALLKSLQVSHPQLEKLRTIALANQAIGSKLTGGGRGGCLISLITGFDNAQQLAQVLLGNGAQQTWVQPLAAQQKGIN